MRMLSAVLIALLATTACSEEDGGAGGAGGGGGEGGEGGEAEECPGAPTDPDYAPDIDPPRFVDRIDHPLLPMLPGSSWTYEGDGETIVVTVTDETRDVMGVTTTVVRDTVTDEDGELMEDTFDWFAQDEEGNVWYFGEDTKDYEDGVVVDTGGSWEAGVDGAQPGIVMFATPPPAGENYYQEFYLCEAEDEGQTVSTDESVSVPTGDYEDCLQTRDFTRLEPDANEHKYYCPGVGLVLEVDIATGDRVELVEFVTGD